MSATRLPGSLRVLLAASFVSSIGSGLTLPFLVIYLHQVRHIPLSIAGLLIGAMAVLALPVGPWAGALVDRFSARAVLLVALSLEGLGIASLATIHSALSALPAMFVYGLGQAAGWSTWNALLGVMVGDEAVSRLAFARNFQLLNLGLGMGAVIGGLVVHVRDPGSFVAIYLVDGCSNLAVVLALALLHASAFHPMGEAAAATEPGPKRSGDLEGHERPIGYRAVFADGLFRRYALTLTLLMLAGYGALNTGFVGFATSVAKAGPGTIAYRVRRQHLFYRGVAADGAAAVRGDAAQHRARDGGRRLRSLMGRARPLRPRARLAGLHGPCHHHPGRLRHRGGLPEPGQRPAR